MATRSHTFLHPLRSTSLLATALSLTVANAPVAATQPAGAPDAATCGPVLVIVKVPRPWYAPRFVVVGKMRETLPQYASLPGLLFKAFSFAQADGAYGGLYLWKDKGSAAAWFSAAWFDRVQRERGATAQVRLLQVVAATDTVPGGTPTNPDSPAVATLMLPLAGSAAARPQPDALDALSAADRRVPGLLRRYRVVDDAGRAGVFSLWRDATAARQQLDAAEQAAAEWFDTPVLLTSTLPSNQPCLSAR